MTWYNQPDSWEPGNMLMQDGFKGHIDSFWAESGLNPAKDFYAEPRGMNRCWMGLWLGPQVEQAVLPENTSNQITAIRSYI